MLALALLLLTVPAAAQTTSGSYLVSVPVPGVAIVAFSGPIHGFMVANPLIPADQGWVVIAAQPSGPSTKPVQPPADKAKPVQAEPLYLNIVDDASVAGSINGNNFALEPGASFVWPTGPTVNIRLSANSMAQWGHKFTCTRW
jgi:hypothetical protein